MSYSMGILLACFAPLALGLITLAICLLSYRLRWGAGWIDKAELD